MSRPQLYCDIDSTVNDHWRRIQRNSEDCAILPSAFSEAEAVQDQPLPDAVRVLKRFAEVYDVHFLSSRNWQDAYRITREWLVKHDFPFKSINLVCSHHDKIPFLKEHWCDLYIDDFSFNQEFGGPPCPMHDDIIWAMPCPYEVFKPEDPECWSKLEAKYFADIPNGEKFWQLMIRNLEWWRVNRDFESRARSRYYENFCKAMGINAKPWKWGVVAEVGAGPFGGLIRHINGNVGLEVYVDILANAQRVLRFIDWPDPKRVRFVDAPVEAIPEPDKSFTVTLSYNAIDHGSDVIKALDEIVRTSRECYLAFDCKGDTAPPHDRIDHYQIVEYKKVCAHMERLKAEGKITELTQGDLRAISPKDFYFEHNWDYPIYYCHAIAP